MRHLCWLPLMAAVLLPAEIGRSAEPPIRCRLELVRLEVLPQNQPWPENERLFRFSRGLQFFLRTAADAAANPWYRQQAEELEKSFKEAVRKEPKKYQAEIPFRVA